MSTPNKCIKDENGNDVWISRSTVVIPIVFNLNEKTGEIYTVVEKRGPVVSHPGEWCCPCGYLDWDESLIEACQREVKEETGITLDKDKIFFITADSNKKSSNQSVDLIYMCWTNDTLDMSRVETTDEILDLKWLKVGQVFTKRKFFKKSINIKIFKKSIEKGYGTWAFKTHPKRIIEMLKMVVKNGKAYEVDE